MSEPKKYPLSLNGDTFNAFKQDFDQMLRELLTQMEEWESEEAVINMKMVVGLAKDEERDFEANGYDAMKDITKPTFKHEISTVMQIKNKKSGNLGGSMKLVWDKELHQYVMQEIDNGQVTLFDKEEEQQDEGGDPPEIVVVGGELPPPPPELPAPKEDDGIIDAEYTVVSEDGGEGEPEPVEGEKATSGGDKDDTDTPFGYLKQFVGAELRVVEAAGNITVRTKKGNKVILSSGGSPNDPFYCPREKLLPHVGLPVVCVGYGGEEIVNISIECEECNEVLFDMDAPGQGYEDPT